MMNQIKERLSTDMLYLWQIIQNVMAMVYLYYAQNKVVDIVTDGEINYVILSSGYNVTLGKYVFLDVEECSERKANQQGHYIQSKLLGPFYIPLILIPSALWSFSRHILCPSLDRDWFYTERWANRLYEEYYMNKNSISY